MTQHNFIKFLKNRSVIRNGKYNMQVMPLPCSEFPSGKFNVKYEDREEFLQHYYDYVFEKNKESFLLEKPFNNEITPKFDDQLTGVNMIKMDLDFRFKPTNNEIESRNLSRVYKIKDIEIIIKKFVKLLNAYMDIPNGTHIYLLEKERPILDKKAGNYLKKDGIHLFVENYVAPNKVLHKVREEMIEDQELVDIFEGYNSLNPINDIIDKRIIDTNGWFMYGSMKPKNLPYIVTKTYEIKNNNAYVIKEVETPDNMTLVKNMANLFASKYVKLKDASKSISITPTKNSSSSSNNSAYDNLMAGNNRIKRPTCDEYIQKYTKCLIDVMSVTTASDYTKWFNVGQSLYNIDFRNIQIFKEFSQKSPSYDETSCEENWKKFEKYCFKYPNCNLNLLINYAKEDNPSEFKKQQKLFKTDILSKIIGELTTKLDSNLKLGPVALTFAKLTKTYLDGIGHNLKCINDGKTVCWYYYQNHRWNEDKGGVLSIDKVLENDYFNDFTHIGQLIDRDISSNDLKQKDARINNNNTELEELQRQQFRLKNQLIVIKEIIKFLEGSARRKELKGNLATEYHDPEFYKNIDVNSQVFVCANGVLDLNTLEFRDGAPKDMMMLHSGIEYIPIETVYDDTYHMEKFEQLLECLDKIIPDKELQNYWLDYFARALDGKPKPEELHIFTGVGSNGKTRLMNVLMTKVFGNYYYKMDSGNLTRKRVDPNAASPAIAALRGKRLVICEEPEADGGIATGFMKELTGGGELTARELHKPLITFTPTYSMGLICNDKPSVESTDEGTWRRLNIVKFTSRFLIPSHPEFFKTNDPDKYPNIFPADMDDFDGKLMQWAPYMLTLLFERYKNIKSNGFKLNKPKCMKMELNEYRQQQNKYDSFKKDYMLPRSGEFCSTDAAFRRFRDWAGTCNISVRSITKQMFCVEMEKLLGKIHNNKWKNWELLEHHDIEAPTIEESSDEET
jgi:P4 family phage/plasmid primase-like protien